MQTNSANRLPHSHSWPKCALIVSQMDRDCLILEKYPISNISSSSISICLEDRLEKFYSNNPCAIEVMSFTQEVKLTLAYLNHEVYF